MRKFKDLSGQKFNHLLVLSPATSHRKKSGCICRMWNVRCDCGAEKAVRGDSLKRGTTRSCGCKHEARRVAACTKHGFSGKKRTHPIYQKWESMKARCYSQTHVGFKDYGAVGIEVDEPWKSSFIAFKDDMLSSYIEGYSLDRIDPRKNYNKENCRWIPLPDQWDNSKRTVFVRLNGVAMTQKTASVKLGISTQKASAALRKHRISRDEAQAEMYPHVFTPG